MSYAGDPEEKFHYVGFKGIEPSDRDALVRELRGHHFHCQVVPSPDGKLFVMVDAGDDPDIVPIVEIFKRVCRGAAKVMHVHLTEAELVGIEGEIARRRATPKGRIVKVV